MKNTDQALFDYFDDLLIVDEPAPVVLPETSGLDRLLAQIDELKHEQSQPEPEPELEPETETETEVPPPANEFQTLFFGVDGLTLAVPLSDLGAIYDLDAERGIEQLTRLPGRPSHVLGVSEQRGEKIQAVDTTELVMPQQIQRQPDEDPGYRYLVRLGETQWALACHELQGTQLLHRDHVKWRTNEGKRPWLAGMVVEKMCALLAVDDLVGILEEKSSKKRQLSR